MKLRAYAIRGLAGGAPFYFSGGMDTLARKLGAAGVACSVHEQGSFFRPYGEVATLFADALHAARTGADLVFIGHSMGADAALRVAVKLASHKIVVPLIVCFDPTSFRGGLLGPPPIPGNARLVLNFYQKVDPVGRGRLRGGPDFRGRLIEERHNQPHITIDDDPALHARVLAEIAKLKTPAAA